MPTHLPPHHRYERDGLPTRRDGPEGCLHCPLPASHPVHQLDQTDPDVKAAEARRLGESE